MRVHFLQHVPFEGLGSIETFLQKRNHPIHSTQLFANQPLPDLGTFDFLIVMGGPMGVFDDEQYPWLAAERKFIRKTIESGKNVLGICLGAQLIAASLGAKVYKNKYREIGWFPIHFTQEAKNVLRLTTNTIEAFHWHGDTFDIPNGAVALAQSEACLNQGFIVNERVYAFQFHLETTPESATALIEHCRHELDGSKYVQSENEMLLTPKRFETINRIMSDILQLFEKL